MGNRIKMSPAERAKQFMPFAALKGYEEALRAKEKEVYHNGEEVHFRTIRSNKLADRS